MSAYAVAWMFGLINMLMWPYICYLHHRCEKLKKKREDDAVHTFEFIAMKDKHYERLECEQEGLFNVMEQYEGQIARMAAKIMEQQQELEAMKKEKAELMRWAK